MKRVERQERALYRLEEQLESGVKTTKEGEVKLSEKDTDRIKKEIQTLKTKIR